MLNAISDLDEYIQSFSLNLTESSLRIFEDVEKNCMHHNVIPFCEDYLVSLMNNVPTFLQTIRKLGGNPEKS